MELAQTLDLAAVGRSFGFAVPPHIDLGVGYRFDHYLIFVCFLFFVKKVIDLPGGPINDPLFRYILFVSYPPSQEFIGHCVLNS